MANVVERQILLDGPRNAIVKFSGVLDTGNASVDPAIALSDFSTNDQNLILSGLRVDEVEWSLSDGLVVVLGWHANSPQQIAVLSSVAEMCFEYGGGLIPDMSRSGYDGSIEYETKNYPAGTVAGFTILLKMTKLYRR